MRANQHDARLLAREAQTRGWTAPMPDPMMLSRAGEAPRMRMEWETRDTMNNRLWADTMATGAKTVTSAMLAAHPTAGAEAWMPGSGRRDPWTYDAAGSHHSAWSGHGSSVPIGGPEGVGFAHMPGIQERPAQPSFGGWLAAGGVDTEGPGASREMRGIVKEDLRGREIDSAGRLAERTYQTQWLRREDQQRAILAQVAAVDALRPVSDDYRVGFRGGSQ